MYAPVRVYVCVLYMCASNMFTHIARRPCVQHKSKNVLVNKNIDSIDIIEISKHNIMKILRILNLLRLL